jgi:hemin uptake protein HemP
MAPARPSQGQPHDTAAAPSRRLYSRDLLGSGKEVEIVHGSQCYRLRLTALGKLILTK